MGKRSGKLFDKKRQQVAVGVAIVSFAVLGIVALRLSNAATTAAAAEAESGVVAGNAGPGSIEGASGDASVKFGVGGPSLSGKRIAYSADGNQHDDDDWSATPMMMAILAKKGMQANLVHLDYNDHIWDSSPQGPQKMRDSVNGAVQRWGFSAANVFDDLTQYDASTANLVEEINKSTANDELWFSLAGPMETAYRAMAAANPAARQHVKCISHGEWNETHGRNDHGGHDYEDLIDLGCQRVQIPDQNSRMGPTNVSFWNFLRDSSNPDYNWLYTRLEQPTQSRGDVSDSGMVWYTLTGNQTGSREDIKELLLSP